MPEKEVWWRKVVDKNFTKIVQLYEAAVEEHETELFTKLLDKDFDINYRIPDDYIFEKGWLVGHTILQVSYCRPDICQILINNGADYTITNKIGSTHLIEKTTKYEQHGYLDSVELHASRIGPYANVILSAHINSGNFTNPKDDRGLSHFLVSCMYNEANAVKFFLENGVPINETVNSDSNFCPGFTALHFAAKSRALQTVELLLSMGADMFAKDSKGMLPLHVLIFESRQTFVRLKRRLRMTSADQKTSNYSNMCRYYIENKKIIYLLLDRMKEFSFYLDNDTGLSYFHVLCFMGKPSTIKQFLDDNREYLEQSMSNDSPVWPGFTPLHIAAHTNVETVQLLVDKGADLSAKDANGVTPFDICLREFSITDVHRILSLQPDYSSIVFSDGKNKLCDFIQAMQDTVTFKNFLKDNLTDPNAFIPLDSPVCAGITALHLTIICTEQPMTWSSEILDDTDVLAAVAKSEKSLTYLSRIDLCLRHNPDVTTRDARGLTSLHWAFRLQQGPAVHRLLERHETSSNYVDEHGLSHLHIACVAKNEPVVRRLLSRDAKVNEAVTSSYTWLDLDTVEARYILKRGHKCFIQEGSTPLHFATIVDCPKIVEILIDSGADVLAQDADGLSPLERIFEVPIFRDSKCPKPSRMYSFTSNENEIAKLLVRKIGDRLVDTKPKQMLYCYTLLEDKLLSEILSHGDESSTKILESVGITSLHVACFTRNLLQVNQLVDKIDVNARIDLESPLWPGCTPLHLFVKSADGLGATNKAIVKKLLRRGADVTAMNGEGETPIHECFPYTSYFVDKLLVNIKNFSVNPASKRGFTHLHIASALGGDWIVEKLLQQGAFVDEPTHYIIPDFGGYTALHLAAAYRQKNVVDVLIKHGADVNWRNAFGGNSLHAANEEIRWPCLELLQSLIGAGADIHARNMFGDSPFETLIKSFNRAEEEVELFLALGCRVNTFNLISDQGLLAIALNKSRDELPIFEIFCKAPDVKDIGDNGRNAIHNAVAFKRPDWESLDDEDDINEKYAPSDVYIKGIATLIKLGLNIDQQDCKGSTPLHLAAQMKNLNGIIALLENGADINITNADGKSAFARSLELAEICEEPTELDLCILQVISTHVYKLNSARIGISPSNREVETKIRENYSVDPPRVEECCDKIERMREQQINSTSVTLYEFLSDTGAVSAFPHMLLRNRVAINSFFKNEIEILRESFPELTGVLLLQYRKALVRCDMIDPAVTSLNILVGFNMPAICTRIILRFLSNDELNNLINSTTDE